MREAIEKEGVCVCVCLEEEEEEETKEGEERRREARCPSPPPAQAHLLRNVHLVAHGWQLVGRPARAIIINHIGLRSSQIVVKSSACRAVAARCREKCRPALHAQGWSNGRNAWAPVVRPR